MTRLEVPPVGTRPENLAMAEKGERRERKRERQRERETEREEGR
jgi:hypothetical protein